MLTIFLVLVGLPGNVSVTAAQANIVAIFFRNPVLSSVEGAAGGDYRLREESPCVDAAPPRARSDDVKDIPRPIGDGYDMGAHEFFEFFEVYLPLVARGW